MRGFLSSAARTIEASCVLSPSSIREMSENVLRNVAFCFSILIFSLRRISEKVPKIMNTRPEPKLTHSKGRKPSSSPPIKALTPSTKKKASMDPAKTDMAEAFEESITAVSCVLSPNSARKAKAVINGAIFTLIPSTSIGALPRPH